MKSRTIKRSLTNPKADAVVMPRTEREYDAMVAKLRALCDEVTDDVDPRNRLIETLAALTEKYEHEHYSVPDASPVDVLRFLMEQHDLGQGDLREEIGTQGVVSEVLHGHRQLNLRQIRALATRFGVEPSAFIARRPIVE